MSIDTATEIIDHHRRFESEIEKQCYGTMLENWFGSVKAGHWRWEKVDNQLHGAQMFSEGSLAEELEFLSDFIFTLRGME